MKNYNRPYDINKKINKKKLELLRSSKNKQKQKKMIENSDRIKQWGNIMDLKIESAEWQTEESKPIDDSKLKWHNKVTVDKTIYLIRLPDNMTCWDDITDEQLHDIAQESVDLDLEVGISSCDANGNEIAGAQWFYERLLTRINIMKRDKENDRSNNVINVSIGMLAIDKEARDIPWIRIASNISVDDIDKPRKVLVSEKYKVYRAKDYRNI